MNRADLEKHFLPNEIDAATELNPLAVAEDAAFRSRSHTFANEIGEDYRHRAIKRVCLKKLPFESTGNSLLKLVQMMLTVKCPYCGGSTHMYGSGGNAYSQTFNFQCDDCGAGIGLHLPNEAMRFTSGNK